MKDAAWFERNAARALEALAWNERRHTEDEQQRAIERAAKDWQQIEGRREPTQHELTLAA